MGLHGSVVTKRDPQWNVLDLEPHHGSVSKILFFFLQGSWPALTINRQSFLQSFLGGEGHDCPRGREVSWTKLPGRWQEKWSFSHSKGKTSWFSSVYLDYLRGNSMVSWCFLCHLFLLQWWAAGATDSWGPASRWSTPERSVVARMWFGDVLVNGF